ncbi:MAG: hypothetical protein MK209_08930 [Planctomycetes bacterium]|nr:hypothetical protein [Planctomycetota bacterium]
MLRISLSILLAALAAPKAEAQSAYTFDVDVSTSNFTFGGDSSVGRIKGRPPTFDMDGEVEMTLTRGSSGFSDGEMTGGVLYTVPARIKAEVPNVFSWLPPLATIYIDDAEYTGTSASFRIDAAGNFSTDIVMTPIGGTVTVIPLVGNTEVTNLADYGPTDPTPISGNVVPSGTGAALTLPIDVFFYSDDGAGNWVQLDLDGTLNARAEASSDMTLSTPGAVIAGTNADLNVVNATPSSATFVAYGLKLGSTPVPPLGITLDLARAEQLGGTVIADGRGNASWTLPVPSSASGVTAYLQACQNGRISNVLTVNIR